MLGWVPLERRDRRMWLWLVPNKLEYKTVLYYKVLLRYKTVFFGTISVRTRILLYKTVSYRLNNYSMIWSPASSSSSLLSNSDTSLSLLSVASPPSSFSSSSAKKYILHLCEFEACKLARVIPNSSASSSSFSVTALIPIPILTPGRTRD